MLCVMETSQSWFDSSSGDCHICFEFFSGFSGFPVLETIKLRNPKTTELKLNLEATTNNFGPESVTN